MQNSTSDPAKKTALIIGASGLVGGYCLEYLLNEPVYESVTALLRQPLAGNLVNHPKLKQVIINFDRIADYKEKIKGHDVYCAIGTTFLKSPHKQDYHRIDYTYPVEIAKIALENGAQNFALVSALSANPKSFLFYSRVKGQLEQTISNLNINMINREGLTQTTRFHGVYLFRPSYLLGKRKEKRPIEKIGQIILVILKPFLQGHFKKYRAIEAKAVAYAMVRVLKEGSSGTHIYLSDQIQKIYDK